MTGTVTSIRGTQKSYCRITDTTGTIYFAHRNHFVDPSAMVLGNKVEFLVGKVQTGPHPVALEVVALQRLAGVDTPKAHTTRESAPVSSANTAGAAASSSKFFPRKRLSSFRPTA